MNDRERLIELMQTPITITNGVTTVGEIKMSFTEAKFIADHLLANGVIVPLCKVGDMVYIIDEPDFEDDYVLGVQVSAVGRDIGGVWVALDLPLGFKRSGYIGATEIGRTIFLTKEEAEQALKERESNA